MNMFFIGQAFAHIPQLTHVPDDDHFLGFIPHFLNSGYTPFVFIHAILPLVTSTTFMC